MRYFKHIPFNCLFAMLIALGLAFKAYSAQLPKPYFNQALKLYYFSVDGQLDSTTKFYDYAEPFKEGIALVRYQRKWQFLDSQLNVFCDVYFSEATGFNHGFATVYLNNGQCQVVNKHKQFLFKDPVDQVSTMQNGYLAFSLGGKWGLVNDTGLVVIAPSYERISDVYQGAFWAKQSGRWTLMSLQGQVMMPQTFDVISPMQGGEILASNATMVYRIQTATGKILQEWTIPVVTQQSVCKALYIMKDLAIIQLVSGEFIAYQQGKLLWQKQASQLKTNGVDQIAIKENGWFKLYDMHLQPLSEANYEDLDFYPDHCLKIYQGPYYYFKTPQESLIR